MSYSGPVRARQRCEYGGTWYNAGAVFEVTDVDLWTDDPWEAVEIIADRGGPDNPITRVPQPLVRPIVAPVRPARERPWDPSSTGRRID
jgi:hypothetical protein